MTAPMPWDVPGRVQGIDVSGAQAPSLALMQAARRAGCISCDVKGTDYDVSRAAPFIDPTMVRHLGWARTAGLKVGVYGFFKSTLPWQVQAEEYLRALDLAGPLDIRPTLDWEDQTRIASNPSLARDGVVQWCEFVGVRRGRRPTIYTAKACVDILLRAKVDASAFLCYDLWDAHYRWNPADGRDFGLLAPTPIVIAGSVWTPVAWQCGGNGAPRIPGVDVDIDRDVYYLPDADAFDAWCEDKPVREAGLQLTDTDRAPAHAIGVADRAEAEARALAELYTLDSNEPDTVPETMPAKVKSGQMPAVRPLPIDPDATQPGGEPPKGAA